MGFQIENDALFWIEDGVLRKYNQEESMTEVIVPEGVTTIGDSAFAKCKSLTDIELPKSIESIGDRAFLYCNELENINISNVKEVGDFAFYGCPKLPDRDGISLD